MLQKIDLLCFIVKMRKIPLAPIRILVERLLTLCLPLQTPITPFLNRIKMSQSHRRMSSLLPILHPTLLEIKVGQRIDHPRINHSTALMPNPGPLYGRNDGLNIGWQKWGVRISFAHLRRPLSPPLHVASKTQRLIRWFQPPVEIWLLRQISHYRCSNY